MNKETHTITGIKNVTINEEFFNGHSPGYPIMPGVLIVEGMAQCLGVLVIDELNLADKVLPLFAGIDSAKFKKGVRPGDQLVYEAAIDKIKMNIVKAHGVAKVDGKVVCQATFSFCIAEK